MVFTDNTDRNKKQSYLREHILEKGYDPEKFCEFLETIKSKGADIDNWTLNDIETMVELFQREEDDKFKTSKFKLQEFDLDDTENEIYAKRIVTQKKKTTLLGINPMIISIKEHELVEGGFFSSQYALFRVVNKGNSVVVKRRASDFEWLHSILIKEFPISFVPPVFKASEKLTDKATIYEQKMIFRVKTFINDILEHPELRKSECLESFLLIVDDNEFQQKKKFYDTKYSKKHPRSQINKRNLEYYPGEIPKLEEFSTISGNANIKICKNLKQFYHSYQEYLTTADELTAKVSKLSKDLLVGFDGVKTIMSELAEYFSLMHQLNMEFNQKSEIGKDIVQEKIFFSLQNSFNCWSEVTSNHIKNVDKHLSKFFEYQNAEILNLKELVKTRNVLSAEYYKNKKELNQKKELMISQEVQQKPLEIQKLMAEKACLTVEQIKSDRKLLHKFIATRETQIVKTLADYFGFFNNKIYEQQQRYNQHRNKKSIKNFIEFSGAEVKLVTQAHLIWAEITSHLSDYKTKVEETLQNLNSAI